MFGNCEAAIFINSLCNPANGDGFPEDRFSESDEEINYMPIIGTRVRLVRPKVEERTGKENKQVVVKDGKTNTYDRRELMVSQVYEVPSAKTKGANGNGHAAKTGAAKGGKGTGVDDLAAQTILAILAKEKSGRIEKSKLSMRVLTSLTSNPQREPVRKLVNSDDFLGRELGWNYDSETEVLTVA